jgi:ribosome-associated protein YbcJ (S4-like RNA binding protein)
MNPDIRAPAKEVNSICKTVRPNTFTKIINSQNSNGNKKQWENVKGFWNSSCGLAKRLSDGKVYVNTNTMKNHLEKYRIYPEWTSNTKKNIDRALATAVNQVVAGGRRKTRRARKLRKARKTRRN